MREILLDELKDRQIAILDVVDAFCRENNINYWLDSGTLLGAIRHGDIFRGMTTLILECCAQTMTGFWRCLISSTNSIRCFLWKTI